MLSFLSLFFPVVHSSQIFIPTFRRHVTICAYFVSVQQTYSLPFILIIYALVFSSFFPVFLPAFLPLSFFLIVHFSQIFGIADFWTFSIVQYSKEHNVTETGSVSVLRRGGERQVLHLVP
jgi:hypothetical protein